MRAVLAVLPPERVAVAVSGGIDSLCLAAAAAPVLGERLEIHHAVSPAVPPEATARARALAARLGVGFHLFDAGEFADERYRANPADRCFFCKNSLYGAIAGVLARDAGLTVLSGTNTDDLGEWRPGLRAAATHGVRHPFVEAGIDKGMLRRIAPLVGLGALADLPAAPCLSSRVETGIRIEAALLELVHAAERHVAAALQPRTVRLRVRRDRLVVELDPDALGRLDADTGARLGADVAAMARARGEMRPVSFAGYRNGGAFLRPDAPPAVHRTGAIR
ncbi:MAG: adenine nucleotide alpha hydrolase [Gluconacetobacter diazotrophicus]|nr:adenine nucleotide alpha hydrolase [Gluconacetobacter diazotrophicus]